MSFIFKEHSYFFLLNKKEKRVCEFFKSTLLFQASLTGKGAQKNFYLKWGTIHKAIRILLGYSKKPSEFWPLLQIAALGCNQEAWVKYTARSNTKFNKATQGSRD